MPVYLYVSLPVTFEIADEIDWTCGQQVSEPTAG